jgi:small ligand-binding sensory domain FIST
MAFAAALSEHPDASQATGEVVGHVLDQVGEGPDLALLFVTGPHVAAFEDIASAVRELLHPSSFAGTTAVSIIGGDREVEEQPAMTLWAARFDAPAPVYHLDTVRTGDGIAVVGIDHAALDRATTMLLLADPMTFPVDEVVRALGDAHPNVSIIGGMASAGFAPGANRLAVDDVVHTEGAVAVLLDDRHHVSTVVSQGCRPIGAPLVVTRAEQNVVHEIAGAPALERLEAVFAQADEHERELMQNGLHIGLVIDEHKLDFGRGDFLIRNVMGADRETGAVVIGDAVEIGATVQFHVRDAEAADEDLRELFADRRAEAALVFTCNGRGLRLFGRPDHDAEIVDTIVKRHATAGMFCAGEIGPVGNRNFLHGFTASVALFGA